MARAVTHCGTDAFYERADLFLFPTLSDGFGLTNLEAQAWSLPIVASRFCGEVVRDGVN
jgi:glycosyltransferase involved in cell wall biosynthesis